jgi:hypothetical protein
MKRYWVNRQNGEDEHSPDWLTESSWDTYEEALAAARKLQAERGGRIEIWDSENNNSFNVHFP